MVIYRRNRSTVRVTCRTLKGLRAVCVFYVYRDFVRDKNGWTVWLIMHFLLNLIIKTGGYSSPLLLLYAFLGGGGKGSWTLWSYCFCRMKAKREG